MAAESGACGPPSPTPGRLRTVGMTIWGANGSEASMIQRAR
jgi:hypothetical protein